ncbi:biopolymer transport protein ExbB [Paracoccus aminovorans]|uniref:Biopolymer transport protein ExbB n=2 Tax=Paracoccus aminovorans TaxID=34004 RepID=A0A1I2ZL46_9RHOB|nr:tonB-system energizer ExbB [Paracoccus aminovorans]CQR85162.1 biopolymer transport protein ExbB/TolQ [Paracoccus aminovorans]SFH37841.1 biopolymer transport protein ExbB [Paracoccus aminovorans]
MTNLTLPRPRAGTALALACLMLATPISAQDNAAGTQPVPAAPEAQTAQPQPAPEAAPQQAAPAPVTTPAPVGTPAPTETAPAASAPTPAATPDTVPAPAPETATGDAAPAAAQSPAAADTAAPEGTPAPAAAAEVPAPESNSILPQALQDALDPVLNPSPRDPSLPHDLSPWGMFLAADWVVKGVMIGLAFASIITWTVLVAKMLELAGAMKRAQSGIRRIEGARGLPSALDAAGNRRDPVSRMIRAAASEYDRSAPALDQAGDTGVKERVDSHLDRIEAVAGRRMSRGTGVLATIGSTAPFVGLFGTVWGIMNSFIGISQAQTTNLAVVAPGIAEALLATALGLVAAIPAVVIYNVFARAITGYRLRLANAAAGIKRLVSRDLDFRGATPRAEV